MPFVCPHCRRALKNTSDTCPSCGRVFNKSEWIPEAYSPANLVARLSFRLPGGGVWEALRGASEFFIGTNPGANGLKLGGIGWREKHARVFADPRGDGWWIQAAEGEIFVSGQRAAAPRELAPGTNVRIGLTDLIVTVRYAITKDRNAPAFGGKTIEKTPLTGDSIAVGSAYTCGLRVSGASSVHAKIYRNRASREWWIVNCSPAGTFVNGDSVHNEKLTEGDVVGVAGTRFVFSPSALLPFALSGFRVDVENAGAVRGGKKILDGVNLHVGRGEFVGVLGPSGCGKSSLIQRIVGLDVFDTGALKIDDVAPGSPAAVRIAAGTAYLPQLLAPSEDLTVAEEARAFCGIRGIDEREIAEKLRVVGLSGESAKRVGDLSGGQQRRLGIALELLRRPQLLVLDEPTSGLDPKTETEVMTYLRRIAAQGKTVICSTHIMGNLNLFDKVLLMARGRVVFFGTPRDLLSAFGAKTPYELYGKLDDARAVDYFAKKAAEKTAPRNVTPASAPRGNARGAAAADGGFSGYLRRTLFEFLSFRNSKNRIAGFLQSALFIQLVVQPVLVAAAIKISCAYKMTGDAGAKETLFFCAVAVFWLGLNNTIRELVRERVPRRCLERMEGIGSGAYLCAKIAWSAAVALAQIVLFSVVLYALPRVSSAGSGSHEFAFSPGIFIVLFLVGLLGALVGLAISAFFRRENAAVGLLPIVLIPVLFFSQPIVREGEDREAPIASAIVEVMPCHEPQMLLHEIDGRNVSEETLFRAARNGALYALLALGLTVFFQNRREREWNGR